MWMMLYAALAWGGAGAYLDFHAGGGWTERLGPIQRGAAGAVSIGGYGGRFRGTYRFGNYYRFGVGLQWNPLWDRQAIFDENGEYTRQAVFVESLYMPTLEIGRGADLMNLAVWWVLAAGPVLVSDKTSPFEPGASIGLGAGTSAAIVGGYSLGRSFAITFRLTGGVQLIEGVTSASGGLGLGFLIRAPLVPLRYEDS